MYVMDLPCGSVVENLLTNIGDMGSISRLGGSPGEGNGLSTPVFLPGISHGQRSLVSYSPRGHKRVGHSLATQQHICIYKHIHYIFFIHSSVRGHLGCLHVLAVVNSAAMNTEVNVYFWIINRSFLFYECVSRDGIVVLYSNSIFKFLVKLHFFLHCGFINLHFHQCCMNVPFLHTLSSIYYL